jgi:hypothetical protein
MVAADARTAISFALSPGQASDTIEGRKLLGGIGPLPAPLHLIMDRAYEDNQTLQLALDFGFFPWFHRGRSVSSLGCMTKLCTVGATKSSDCSAGSKAFGASFPALTNSTWSSSTSLLS